MNDPWIAAMLQPQPTLVVRHDPDRGAFLDFAPIRPVLQHPIRVVHGVGDRRSRRRSPALCVEHDATGQRRCGEPNRQISPVHVKPHLNFGEAYIDIAGTVCPVGESKVRIYKS